MKKTNSKTKARRPLLQIQRRWIQSRPGSVLILVIALLVLLALIGTAFLSTTQTERYSSQQNSVNTEADLLVQGLQNTVQSNIANGLFASTGTGQQFRPPGQEMPTYNGATEIHAPATSYNNYDSGASDLFLGDRFPLNATPQTAPIQPPVPYWNSISWPLFTDANGYYNFDSPFGGDSSATLYLASNKSQVQAYPTYRIINGQMYPAMLYFIPAQGGSVTVQGYNNSLPISMGSTGVGVYLTPNSPIPFVSPSTPEQLIQANGYAGVSQYANFAASAAGDGVADSGMFKLPIGPVNNITYYAAIRVIDNNSAVNVSTAWTSSTDPVPVSPSSNILQVYEPLRAYSVSAGNMNYGFFRSGIGLREMLNPASLTTPSPGTLAETDQLNALRFGTGNIQIAPALSTTPYQDQAGNIGTSRSDFAWTTGGDALDHQLAGRPGNPGYLATSANPPTTSQRFSWLGQSQSAALAYKFSLKNLNNSQSLIEQALSNETYNTTYNAPPTSPFSPAQVGAWYNDVFNFTPASSINTYNTIFNYGATTPPIPPLRTILTGSNEVSNAILSRLGNTSATTPVVWNSTTPYNFGDWVTNGGYSFVCLLPNTGQAPSTTPPATGPEYWTLVPWTVQPVKTSINTATFDQLWLGYCQTMTDSILPANSSSGNTAPQWQPPMMTPLQASYYPENQQQMFRSTIRDNRSWPIANTNNNGNPKTSATALSTRLQLTPMQMMQLRAALAAINTQTMRNAQPLANASTGLVLNPGAFEVRSHKITLADTTGAPAYDVEVFGTSIQPYIGQMFAYEPNPNGSGTGNGGEQKINPKFIAIQLLNPYPVPIGVGNGWGFATINRAAYASYTATQPPLTLTPINSTGLSTTFVIPAATQTGPGSIVIYDGTPPSAPQGSATAPFTLPTGTGAVELTGLSNAIGKELVILKPRLLDTVTGITSTSNLTSYTTGAGDYYNEVGSTAGLPNLYDLVPVDQLDMTGLDQNVTTDTYYIYKRGSNPSNIPPYSGLSTGTNGNGFAWNFVWPGFYMPYNSNNTAAKTPTATSAPMYASALQPTTTYPFNQPIIKYTQPPAAGATYTFGPSNSPLSLTGGPSVDTLGYSAANLLSPTYNTISLQLNNVGFPGPNPVQASTGNKFPFGGFARNIDILQVPYIGAYRICSYGTSQNSASPTFSMYEMNSVTMDSSLANDQTLQPSKAISSYSTTYPKKVIPSTAQASSSNPTATVLADTYIDPFVEQIGRFCPIGEPNDTTNNPAVQLDFGIGYPTTVVSNGTTAPDKNYWHYHWTRRVLGYFTVQSPHDDYFPNVDPAGPDGNARLAAGGSTVVIPQKYLPSYTGFTKVSSSQVAPVLNTQNIAPGSSGYYANAQYTGQSEDTTGVEGLININTAPWPVLATLPFVPPGTDNITFNDSTSPSVLTPSLPTSNTTLTASPNGACDNIDLAKAIVAYRNQNGPFKSVMDLYKVPAFRLENEFLLQTDPSSTNGTPFGDFSGGADNTATGTNYMTGPDKVRYDFEERFLLLNNISNLITTRSDSFTVYLLLQGWRNAGTGNPTLAVQRRVAFFVDRNNVTPSNNIPLYFKFPNE
jgi:hypothetical protein